MGNSLPMSYPVDPSAIFEPGTAMSLTVLGSQIVATTSRGDSFFGICDDSKTKSFFAVSWDEAIVVPVLNSTLNNNNQLITPIDIKAELENPNISPDSFTSINVPVQLNARNGVITFPAGTVLNYDLLSTGSPNAIKTLVRYQYQIPNVIGEDSTLGSGQVTLWFQRMVCSVSVFESNQQYRVNSNLFINEKGQFTTRQIHPNSPCIAICTAPPSALYADLQLLLL